jgi:hypothetical protein
MDGRVFLFPIFYFSQFFTFPNFLLFPIFYFSQFFPFPNFLHGNFFISKFLHGNFFTWKFFYMEIFLHGNFFQKKRASNFWKLFLFYKSSKFIFSFLSDRDVVPLVFSPNKPFNCWSTLFQLIFNVKFKNVITTCFETYLKIALLFWCR